MGSNLFSDTTGVSGFIENLFLKGFGLNPFKGNVHLSVTIRPVREEEYDPDEVFARCPTNLRV